MAFGTAFREAAEKFAMELQSQRVELELELFDMEKRRAELEAKLDTAKLGFKRLADYPIPATSVDPACPRCWLKSHDVRMKSITSQTGDDVFACRACSFEITVDYRR